MFSAVPFSGKNRNSRDRWDNRDNSLGNFFIFLQTVPIIPTVPASAVDKKGFFK